MLKYLFEAVGDYNLVAICASYHAALLQIVEHLYKFVPEMVHVIEYHLLVVIAYCCRRRHREHFVEGANAARQRYDYVAMSEQEVLAVAEIIAMYGHIDIVAGLPVLLYDGWDDADVHASSLVASLCDVLHESHIASSEHHGVLVSPYPLAQFAGQVKVALFYVVVSATEYSYVHSFRSLGVQLFFFLGKSTKIFDNNSINAEKSVPLHAKSSFRIRE